MPWCPACERFLAPPAVTPEGRCPNCGQPVEPGRGRVASAEEQSAAPPANGAAPEELAPVPWHLKVIGGATVVYLGWRLVQGIAWVVKHI
jgi:hypothetical protein